MFVHVILEGLFLLLIPPGSTGKNVEVLFANPAAFDDQLAGITIPDHHLSMSANVAKGDDGRERETFFLEGKTWMLPVAAAVGVQLEGPERFVEIRDLAAGQPEVREECMGPLAAETCLDRDGDPLLTGRVVFENGVLRPCEVYLGHGTAYFLPLDPKNSNDYLNQDFAWAKINATSAEIAEAPARKTFNAAVVTFYTDDPTITVAGQKYRLAPSDRRFHANLAALHPHEDFTVIRLGHHAHGDQETLDEPFERHFAMLYDFLKPSPSLDSPAERLIPHRTRTDGDIPSIRCIPAAASVADKAPR